MKKITYIYAYLVVAVIFLDISSVVAADNSAPIIQPGAPGKSSKVLDASEAINICLLYTSPSPRDQRGSRMPSSA